MANYSYPKLGDGGNVSGSGAGGQVTFWTGLHTQSGDANLLWDNVNKRFTITGSSTNTISETFTLSDLSSSNFWTGRTATLAVTPAADSPSDVVINQNLATTISGTRSLLDSTSIYSLNTKSTTGLLSILRGGFFTISNTAGTTTAAESVIGQVTVSGGVVQSAKAFRAIASGAAGTITDFRGFHVDAPSANVTNSYAFRAGDQGLTNNFLYSEGGQNLLQGPLDLLTTIASSKFAFQTLSIAGLAQPYLNYAATNCASLEVNNIHGGLSITGLTDNGGTALSLFSVAGSSVLTGPSVFITAAKADGAGGIQALSATDVAVEYNSGVATLVQILGDGSFVTKGELAVGSDATIGAVGTTDKLWDFSQTITDFTGLTQYFAHQSFVTLNPSADVAALYGHAAFKTVISSANSRNFVRTQGALSYMQQDGAGNIGQSSGFQINSVHNGSGVITLMMGDAVNSSTGAACTGTVTENIGIRVIAGGSSGFSTITTNKHISLKKQNTLGTIGTNIGLEIEDMDFGTDYYSIKAGLGKASFNDNVIIGATSAGATALKTLVLSNSATEPTTSVDRTHLYSKDIAAGRATLGIYAEEAVAADIGIVSTHSFIVYVNGTKYKIPLVLA